MTDRLQHIDKELFYRNSFRKLFVTVMVLVIIQFLLLGLAFYQLWSRPKTEYFATTSDGRLIKIQPAL